jgi:chromosome segregation ATPase
MANEALVASLENALRTNLAKQNETKGNLQDLEKQLQGRREELQMSEGSKQKVAAEASRIQDEYKALLDYYNSNGQPPELSAELQRLQNQQSVEFEKSQATNRRIQKWEEGLQQTERAIKDQQENLKALQEEQKKIDGHITKAKAG